MVSGAAPIRLHPSRALRLVVWVGHVAAMALIVAAALPWWAQSIAVIMIGVSLWRSLARLSRAATALTMNEDGTLSLRNVAGNWTTYDVTEQSYVSAAGVVVLALRVDHARHDEILLPDAADADDLRRLRVWLLWQARQLHADASVQLGDEHWNEEKR